LLRTGPDWSLFARSVGLRLPRHGVLIPGTCHPNNRCPLGHRGFSYLVLDLFATIAHDVRTVGSRVGVVMPKSTVCASLVAILLIAAVTRALAQDPRQNEPGQFDFYVLSLSWSPSFCAAAAERENGHVPASQCGARAYSFVVHGLWPQYDRGFPEYCQVPAPRLDHGIVSSMLDLMPAPHLIFNEWDRHGTCSGLAPRAYFEAVRKARAVVKIPPEFINLHEPLNVTPAAVEDAFSATNPGLSRNGIAIGCDKKRLTEVRICLSKELQFRDCAEIARRSCKRDQLIMPPLRGS
jgi:ribonuclease T2